MLKHFSYYKFSNVQIINDNQDYNLATRAIYDIMINGFTVWSNIDNIGKVSIYDNY